MQPNAELTPASAPLPGATWAGHPIKPVAGSEIISVSPPQPGATLDGATFTTVGGLPVSARNSVRFTPFSTQTVGKRDNPYPVGGIDRSRIRWIARDHRPNPYPRLSGSRQPSLGGLLRDEFVGGHAHPVSECHERGQVEHKFRLVARAVVRKFNQAKCLAVGILHRAQIIFALRVNSQRSHSDSPSLGSNSPSVAEAGEPSTLPGGGPAVAEPKAKQSHGGSH